MTPGPRACLRALAGTPGGPYSETVGGTIQGPLSPLCGLCARGCAHQILNKSVRWTQGSLGLPVTLGRCHSAAAADTAALRCRCSNLQEREPQCNARLPSRAGNLGVKLLRHEAVAAGAAAFDAAPRSRDGLPRARAAAPGASALQAWRIKRPAQRGGIRSYYHRHHFRALVGIAGGSQRGNLRPGLHMADSGAPEDDAELLRQIAALAARAVAAARRAAEERAQALEEALGQHKALVR